MMHQEVYSERSYLRHARQIREAMLCVDAHCAYCREPVDLNNSSLDHKTPKSRGGTNSLSNLVLACRRCNRFKGSLTVAELQDKMRAGLMRVA
jgi:5-methylcytosine-specific restriction endonuclease McrA